MLCVCGCGQEARKRFISGHNACIFPYAPFPESFWQHVDQLTTPDGCWPWIGAHVKKGYGNFIYKVDGKIVMHKAHRMAYELTYGSFPQKLKVLHHCDNPPCCRPDHLFLGTDRDNAQDKIAKGRGGWLHGDEHAQSKLTGEQVIAIRARYLPYYLTTKMLAAEYGVSPSLIQKILSHKERNWQHLPNSSLHRPSYPQPIIPLSPSK